MTIMPSLPQTVLILNVLTCFYPACIGMSTQHNKYSQATAVPSAFILETCLKIYKTLTPEQLARFVDASGKPGSGIYGGSTLWYGSYSECDKLSDTRYCLTIFPGRVSLVENSTETYHFEWGVCVPNVCSSEDVLKAFSFLFKNVSGIHEVTPFTKYMIVHCAEEPEYTASVVITIVFCGLLLGMCLIATIVEIAKDSNQPIKAENLENAGHISLDKDANEKTPLLPGVATEVKKNDDGLIYGMLHCFSALRNIKAIVSTDVGKNDLTYLHGIRVLSLFWIILIHVNNFSLSFWPVDNVKDVVKFERGLSTMVLNQYYGVDTFFVLSGLLVMYTNMSKKVKNNGQTNWFKYYIHRYWRLTPCFMFWVLIVANLRPFFGAGPLWYMETDTSACTDNWWTNLLYLNNFIHLEDKICLVHTWYLSADMQMYVVSPVFLLIAYRYRLRPLLCVVGVTVLASVITTASIVADNDMYPQTIMVARYFTFFRDKLDEVFQYDGSFKDVYVKPYCRVPPYVMGMVLGYVLYEHFSRKFKLSVRFTTIMWISATALALTVIYAPYSAVKEDHRSWTTGESALFWSLKWSIWSLCIIWLIFACHYNFAGFIKKILAAKFWIPLSHINYAAFIVHYDIIKVLMYNIETPIHYTAFTLVTYFLASLVLTYAVSFIIVVVVEFPFANLETLAWKRWENQ